MVTLVLLATAWGSKYGGINVVNMDLTRALAACLGSTGRVLCVVPCASTGELEDAKKSGVELVSLELPPDKLPDYFDPGWVGTTEKALEAVGVKVMDWCIGHDAITGAAANLIKKNGASRGSAIISHMSYSDYQGVKHAEFQDTEKKIREQREILKGADIVIAVGPLLRNRASDVVDRIVPHFIPGLPQIEPRPPRFQFSAVSFGRFERSNDRIKQIQLAAEALADAQQRAREPGGPQILRDNPAIKLIGVSNDEEEAAHLRKAIQNRAKRIVNMRPIPYQEDRDELYQEIAGSSVALMLSWHEGFGLTGWESIAAEVPLVVTEQSGLYQFLQEQGLGGLVRGLRIDARYGDDETPNFTDEDCTRVANQILEIAQDSNAARKAARTLREQLLTEGFSWHNAAVAVLNALGLTCPPGGGQTMVGGGQEVIAGQPSQKLTLGDYLKSVRAIAGRVTLAGDKESRPIQDVFVELEVTRTGAVNDSNNEDGEDDTEDSGEQVESLGESMALRTELRRRRNAPWRRLTEAIPAKDMLDLAHRTLVIGAAGMRAEATA